MPAALAIFALVLAPGGAGSPSATVKVAFLQGEQVVYVNRSGSTLRQAVVALLAGPTAAERKREIASAVPAGTPLRAVSVAGGVATVDLGERFATGTKADEPLRARRPARADGDVVPGVKSVRLLVKGGTPLGLFPGYATRGPITRGTSTRPNVPPPGPPAPAPPTDRGDVRALQQRLADLASCPPRRSTARPASRRGSR